MFGLDWLICALSFSTYSVIKGGSRRSASGGVAGGSTAGAAIERELERESEAPAVAPSTLERAAQADPVALSAIYDQYVGKIYAYIYHRTGQVELAEDLTGQVFMRMLEAVRSGRPWRTSFSGWLYRIAHNLVIDHYRRRGRASFVELEDANPTSTDAEPFNAIQARLDSERLQAALNRLTEEQAEVITLRFLQGLSIAEVAQIMDKTEGAIKALQYRAVLALRRVMQP